MRNCLDEGILQTWFDGELAANDAAQVVSHLNTCVGCAEAARTLEAENLVLSEGLSAEFAAVVPSERLRQRVHAAVAGLQIAGVPRVKRSWTSAVRDFVPSFRVLSYASAMAAILLFGSLALVYLKRDPPKAVAANDRLPEISLLTPKAEVPETAAATKPSKPQPQRELRSVS